MAEDLLPITEKTPPLYANNSKLNFLEIFKIVQYFVGYFKYENTPQELPPHRWEKKAFNNGRCFIIKPYKKLLAVNAVVLKWGIYNEPKEIIIVEPWGGKLNGLKLTFKDFVTFNSNIYAKSIMELITPWLDQLNRLYPKLENVIDNLKVIMLLTSSKKITEQQKNTLENAYKDNNSGVIQWEDITDNTSLAGMAQQGINIEQLNAASLASDYVKIDTFLTQKIKEILGIPLTSINENRERLLQGEMASSGEIMKNISNSLIKLRKWQIENINTKFGTNIQLMNDEKMEKEDKENEN